MAYCRSYFSSTWKPTCAGFLVRASALPDVITAQPKVTHTHIYLFRHPNWLISHTNKSHRCRLSCCNESAKEIGIAACSFRMILSEKRSVQIAAEIKINYYQQIHTVHNVARVRQERGRVLLYMNLLGDNNWSQSLSANDNGKY